MFDTDIIPNAGEELGFNDNHRKTSFMPSPEYGTAQRRTLVEVASHATNFTCQSQLRHLAGDSRAADAKFSRHLLPQRTDQPRLGINPLTKVLQYPLSEFKQCQTSYL